MSGSKKCPECAEMVQMDAKVCRFCAYNFVTKSAKPIPKNSLQSCFTIVAWILCGLILLIAVL